MKRANGSGTIYKRKDAKRRNPYCVYLDGGKDDFGKRIRTFLGSFHTYKEAQNALEQYRQGTYIKPCDVVPLKDVWELYKSDTIALKGGISPNYISCWKNYIAPRLGNEPVASIKNMHMQNVINTCESKASQKFIKAILKNLFSYAVANDLAIKDYTAGLKTQAIEKSAKHKPFTTEEMRFLWENADKDVYKIILLQVYTGTRKSELAGILLENVNLKEQYMIGGEKTAAGKNRIIPIANCILPLVRYFYTISRFAHHKYLIMPDNAKGMLFVGGVVNIDVIYRKNFPNHCTHDARHTFVTMCNNYSQPESLVKKIVGHTGKDITNSVYTHVTAQQLLKVVNSLPFGREMYINPSEKNGSHVATTQ